ncbi:hypothetical protein PSQ39_05450 [Curvibacter sp. HBC28]|uniref:DUF2384 domain-containing protein n=1 Tax=Curvibacter microcysteis TaxID=3026419 RepID=A0ABT5MBX4_9BURK|nr:hypothetical protein [Curvibacter sp. HBC28]MDD0814073.1 hypothetical protein [Curvibacter sp. HBC28]
MNTRSASTPAARVRHPRRVGPPAVQPSPYVSNTQTKALVAGSLAARMARLLADDMLSTDMAANLVGTTRVTINAWISKGRAIGLTQTRRGFRLPRWQFEPALWDVMPQLSQALGTREGWALLSFLETPLGALGGQTPRQAIEQGQTARVLELAGVDGS